MEQEKERGLEKEKEGEEEGLPPRGESEGEGEGEGEEKKASGGARTPESLIDLCVNYVRRNLGSVDLSSCSDDLISRIINVLVATREVSGQHLRKLLTSSSGAITTIDLRDSGHMTSTDLGLIAQLCPQLRSLNLDRCRQVTAETLKKICAASPQLHHLDVSRLDKAVDDSFLTFLGTQCTALESLRLTACYNITDKGITGLVTKAPQLQALDVRACNKITDASLLAITQHCTNLQSIILKMVKSVSDRGLAPMLITCTQLKNLNLKQCGRLTDRAFAKFKCAQLLKCSVAYCQSITEQTVAKVLSVANSLETLDIQGTGITSQEELISAFSQMKPYHSLRKLNVFNIKNFFTDDWAKFISTTRCQSDLQKLYLGTNLPSNTMTEVTDKSLRHYSKGLPNVEKLVFGGMAVTDECLKTVAEGFPKLTSLSIWMCPQLSPDAFSIIRLCTSLEKLTLTDTKTDDAGLTEIAAHCPRLQQIRLLNCNGVTDASITALAAGCPYLSKLLVSGVSITDKGIETAVNSFAGLIELDISYCRLLRLPSVGFIANGKYRAGIQKLSFEGMLWLTRGDVQLLINNLPGLTTFYCAGCDGVRGEPTIPRYDLTVYLNQGTFYRTA